MLPVFPTHAQPQRKLPTARERCTCAWGIPVATTPRRCHARTPAHGRPPISRLPSHSRPRRTIDTSPQRRPATTPPRIDRQRRTHRQPRTTTARTPRKHPATRPDATLGSRRRSRRTRRNPRATSVTDRTRGVTRVARRRLRARACIGTCPHNDDTWLHMGAKKVLVSQRTRHTLRRTYRRLGRVRPKTMKLVTR